jgi:hypothetical protein
LVTPQTHEPTMEESQVVSGELRSPTIIPNSEQGAFGLSSALQYVPDSFASTDEIIELAKVARRYGGVYFTHQRCVISYKDGVLEMRSVLR